MTDSTHTTKQGKQKTQPLFPQRGGHSAGQAQSNATRRQRKGENMKLTVMLGHTYYVSACS